jgi:hypothetical protein
VEPGRRYRLQFAAKTEALVTGGLPVVEVVDADGGANLGAAVTLPTESGRWLEYTLDFSAGAATRAVKVQVKRLSCQTGVCPAFGSAWLDTFKAQSL